MADTTTAVEAIPDEGDVPENQWGKRTPKGNWLVSPKRSVLEDCCDFDGPIVPVTVKETGGMLDIQPVASRAALQQEGESDAEQWS